MTITERRIVYQQWYETDSTKTGWDNYGWTFEDESQMGSDWTIVQHIRIDKHWNPIVGVAEREVSAEGL